VFDKVRGKSEWRLMKEKKGGKQWPQSWRRFTCHRE
jgi:hypothetical protein